MAKPAIGFIGLGLMGVMMAERLIDCGYALQVLGNTNRSGIEACTARGAGEAKNARELAAASDIVMLCVGTSEQVESRIYGDDGVIAGLKKGSVVIDFGTSLPASTKAIGADIEKAGGTYLDAPLGRTPSHGREGKLNIMCSGDEAVFNKIRPVLDDLGENVFHLGELGSGHTIKLINNFFGMTTASAMAEVFAMADAAGLDRQKVYDVMAAGPLRSGMMDFVKGYAVDGDPNQLEFAIKNARKDVGYYVRMVDDLDEVSIMARSTKLMLDMAHSGGYGENTVSEMVDFFTTQLLQREKT